MSRIGNSPVKIPPKVDVTLSGGEISIKGPLGSLSRRFGNAVAIEKSGDTLTLKASSEEANAMHGTVRALFGDANPGLAAAAGASFLLAHLDAPSKLIFISSSFP